MEITVSPGRRPRVGRRRAPGPRAVLEAAGGRPGATEVEDLQGDL